MFLRLFVCFLMLVNVAPVLAAKTVTTTRSYNYYNPYRRGYYPPPNPYRYSNGLNALERYALSRSYGRENDIQRLERLENLAFGAVQNGDLDTRYQQVENAILSRPKYNGYKNTFRNVLGNYIAGQATGVTPSIITQDLMPSYTTGFAPQYTNSNVMQYSSFPFGGRGFHVMNQNYGTNSGIRILP